MAAETQVAEMGSSQEEVHLEDSGVDFVETIQEVEAVLSQEVAHQEDSEAEVVEAVVSIQLSDGEVAMAVADRVVIEAMGYPQEEAEASVHAAVGVASHLEVEEGKAISLHEVDREVSLREVVAGRQNPVVRGEEDVADRSVKNVEPMTTTKRMRLLTRTRSIKNLSLLETLQFLKNR